jgi:ppGpp synthetase/RelA/SpoT-type nucleotidyltranferase
VALKDSKKEGFRREYHAAYPKYERLAKNLEGALVELLVSSRVPYLDVISRVKDFDSAYDKLERKKYSSPFEEIEDWCGVRIICYYPSDVERICSILREEFDVKEEENTAKRLLPHEFGYRSTHLVLEIKKSWLSVPGYRGLGDLKAEVQVRTILMHAWAEVEHKLAYKSTEQVPDQFRRQLYRLSAKFEEADEQFEGLRENLELYREAIREKGAKDYSNFSGQELNLDSLQAFLDVAFPERIRSKQHTALLLDEMVNSDLTLRDLVEAYELLKPIISSMERTHFPDDYNLPAWAQVGVAVSLLEAVNNDFFEARKRSMGDAEIWATGVKKMKDVVNAFLSKKDKKIDS